MKAVLLITLLAISYCNTPVDVVKCFLQSDIVFKALSQLIEAIQSKDMSKIIGVVIQLYGPVYEEIKKCLSLSEVQLSIDPFFLNKMNRLLWSFKILEPFKYPYNNKTKIERCKNFLSYCKENYTGDKKDCTLSICKLLEQ